MAWAWNLYFIIYRKIHQLRVSSDL